MSAILLAALKVAFLVLMWVLILFITNVVRTDLFGRRIQPHELVSITEEFAPKTTPKSAFPTLVRITTGKAQGAAATLPQVGGEIVIGRSASNDLDVMDDYASGQHAKIWCDEEGYVVEDLLSTNGTYVNGHKISQPTRVGPHDIIRVGRSQLQLEA